MDFLPSLGGSDETGPAQPLSESPTSLHDEIVAANAFLDEATEGGTRFRGPLRIEVVRTLTEEDLAEGLLEPAPPATLREIKASHHSLARLIATGRTDVDASRITGYSPGYIARLRGDASFRELVLHYTQVEEIASTDYLGAMREVGMDLLNEFRRRMEEDPTRLSQSALENGIKLLLVEPMKSEALRGGLGGGGGQFRISFVSSETPQGGELRVIEGEKVE